MEFFKVKRHLHIWGLSALLLITATLALRLVFAPQSESSGSCPCGRDVQPTGHSFQPLETNTSTAPCCCSTQRQDAVATLAPPSHIVNWRTPLSSAAECLAAGKDGWVVGERTGRITALTSDGGIRWQVAISNHNWQALAPLPDGTGLVAVSLHGCVCVLDSKDGAPRWSRETDASFMRAPLFGKVGDTPVMWQISQADSTVFCLRVADGSEVWKSEPSNRCDGSPALWNNRLAFGNCDGVVYVLDAQTGRSLGTIATGGQEDPMAGAMLALPSGLMLIGTYRGNFLMLDADAIACLGTAKIAGSESFATPVMIGDTAVAMGTPDGHVTLWETRGRKLEHTGDIPVGKDGIDQVAFDAGGLWVLAGRDFCRVDMQTRTVQAFNIGDDMSALTLNPQDGTLALLADGDVVCISTRRNTK